MENSPQKTEQVGQADSWKDEAYRSNIVPPELPPEVQAKADVTHDAPPPQISAKTMLAFGVLLVAVAAGVTGDALLRATPWGINVLLWTIVLVASAGVLIRRRSPHLLGEGKWLVIPMVFFAAALAWRASAVLNWLSILGLLMSFLLAAFRARTGRMLYAMAIEYVQGIVLAFGSASGGALLLLFGDIHWNELPRNGWSSRLRAALRGVIIALPLLLLFGALLAAADAMFEQLINRAFSFDSGSIFLHLTFASFIAWMVGGFLRWMLLSHQPNILIGHRPEFLKLGIIEIGTVLSLLNLLFLSFVIVQFRYFFGGEANIPKGSGLAYAEYARHGFFELVWVTAFVLPLLLGSHWLLRKDNPRDEIIYRALAGTQIGLLFVIMASAVQRMRLYQLALGMTELRFYTMAFMGWLAVVFIWFALTVLRGHRERFAFGAVMTGFAMIAVLHVVNPDARIVRVNLARASEGRSVDLNYTTSLSADSAEALIEGMKKLKPVDQYIPGDQMSQNGQRWRLFQPTDWRSWNWSRTQARTVAGGLIREPVIQQAARQQALIQQSTTTQ